MKIDLQEAKRFLAALDPDATVFTFQVFDDTDRKDKAMARILHGTLDNLAPQLEQWNAKGAGIFVVVNKTDGQGRKTENIVHVRAVWQEDDTVGSAPALPVVPHVVVETSPGKFHRYVMTDGPVSEFRAVQERLVADYGSDTNAKDAARVLRLPGFYHRKDVPFLVRIAAMSGAARLPWEEVKRVFPPVARKDKAAKVPAPGLVSPLTPEEKNRIARALQQIRPDDYEPWLKVGMAIHDRAPGTEGFGLWDAWSAQSPHYGQTAEKWSSFHLNGNASGRITLGSLFFMAGMGDDPAAVGRIEELAGLTALVYAQQRKEVAKALGVGVGVLDAEVTKARRRLGFAGEEDEAQGKRLTFVDPEPWGEPVDGAALLDELVTVFERYLALPPHGALVLALWVIFTYAIDCAAHAPLLVLVSPVKRCGKTRTFEVLSWLVRRPLPTSNITTAARFRVIESCIPTILLDELDALLEGDSTGEIRGLINAGHTRTTAHVIRTVGEDHEARAFGVWTPKALALIGELTGTWDTVADRAVTIHMQRKPPGSMLPRLPRDGAEFAPLRRKIARWVMDHAEALRDADPALPEKLNDRVADNWRILAAIAEAAGGAWPERVVRAALDLSGAGSTAAGEEDGVRLLSDIRAVFTRLGIDRIGSKHLAHELGAIEDSPWANWNSRRSLWDRRIEPAQVAELLNPFGLIPGSVRLPSGENLKGYRLEKFREAFERYLPELFLAGKNLI